MIIIESNGHSVTYGRFDQIFYPYYKHDMETGNLTREQCQELIEHSFIKMHELRKIRDTAAITFSSGTIMGGTALDVGGVDENGNDITNDLSYMVLDAHAHTRLPNPWMGVRLHENSPWEFKVKTFNVIRIGTGEPKIFNDEPMIESLMNYGKDLKTARNYVGVGCVEPSIPGKTYGWHDSASFNLAKTVQLAINPGRCIDCSKDCPRYAKCAGAGSSLGPDTGGLDTFQSFDEVKESFENDEKKVSGQELLDALKANWEGHEKLYAYVNGDRVHHYGNDDDYADEQAKFVMATYCANVEHRPTAHGGEFMPGVFSVTNNVMHGSVTSATPDGRKAYEPVSDCMGPVHTQCCSHDHRGPTAVANSVSKLAHARIDWLTPASATASS